LAFSAASFSAAFLAASCFFLSFSSCLRRFFISLLDSGSPLALRAGGGALWVSSVAQSQLVREKRTHLRWTGPLSVLWVLAGCRDESSDLRELETGEVGREWWVILSMMP